MTERPLAVLTADEEVTLRRVAFGQSEVRTMRAADLARLKALRLIEPAKDGPQLTASGKRHFDALPKAASLSGSRQTDELLRSMDRMPRHVKR